ncbi:hypothetical protein EG329_013969 [Mollisiaceae sp. DMI_Dod_QoI]|nr:hypothetical protein EG329_013969 [Helotiales sp. DMI_Dod_QoI]
MPHSEPSNTTPSVAAEPNKTPTALVGCLLDVSGSMRDVLETGRGDERAIERLQVVLRAALKLARAEQRHNPNALIFVGAFGMNSKETPVVDLCGLINGLLDVTVGLGDSQSGHDRLIALANEQNVAHVTKYIRTSLTEHQARIVHLHLQRHPEEIQVFVEAIPSATKLFIMETAGTAARGVMAVGGATISTAAYPIGLRLLVHQSDCQDAIFRPTPLPPCCLLTLKPDCSTRWDMSLARSLDISIGAASALGFAGGEACSTKAKNSAVDNSEAMKFALHICKTYLTDFEDLIPRPVSDAIDLLERLQKHPSVAGNNEADSRTLLDELTPHIYGSTFMRVALKKALAVFDGHSNIEQRALVLVSNGLSTDGDPLPLANDLKQKNVIIASIFLTDKNDISRRQLYYQTPGNSLNKGQLKLFSMASTVSVLKHPIPVLAAMGWIVPSSGECSLYITICSSGALEEFCSLLLSARFDSADALLDIIGRVQLDAYINDEHVRTFNNPSDQEQTSTCYAHATAAVLHMALLRIYAREGGCPSIAEIRSKILKRFPPNPDGDSVLNVLMEAMDWILNGVVLQSSSFSLWHLIEAPESLRAFRRRSKEELGVPYFPISKMTKIG